MAIRPTKDEVTEWVNSPVTKWKIAELKDVINLVKEKVITGGTLASEPGLTAQLTAREVGEAAGVQVAIDILEEDIDD